MVHILIIFLSFIFSILFWAFLNDKPLLSLELLKYTYLKINLNFINNVFIKAEKTGDKINVTNPNYIELVNNLIETVSLSEWKQYFIVRILLEFNKYLDDTKNRILRSNANF